MPFLHQRLMVSAESHSGVLNLYEEVRDQSAELRRSNVRTEEDKQIEVEFHRKEQGEITLTEFKKRRANIREEFRTRDTSATYITVARPVGILLGKQMFEKGSAPTENIGRILLVLRKQKDQISVNTEDMSSDLMRDIFRKIDQCVKAISLELERLRAPAKFFSLRNLRVVSKWATLEPKCQGKYFCVDGILKWKTPNEEIVISLPNDYVIPNFSILDSLQKSLSLKSL